MTVPAASIGATSGHGQPTAIHPVGWTPSVNAAVITVSAAGIIRLSRINRSIRTEVISEPTAMIGSGSWPHPLCATSIVQALLTSVDTLRAKVSQLLHHPLMHR